MAVIVKSDLIARVSQDVGISENQASKIVNEVLKTISDALANGEDVRITGFGTFRVVETRERIGRNPRTGQEIRIPAGRRPSFSAGSQLVEAVRSGDQQAMRA